ncbi:hypothetical protein GCM10029964_039390 [Kibdelosporangium lantanae]
MSHTVNLGIVAHVDAGKTSLTERLLHTAGVIDRIGRVDHGDTQTDSLDLERQRGITIKSAVVSFTVDDVTVNLIDTPATRTSSPRWNGFSTCSTPPSWWSRPSKGSRPRPGSWPGPCTGWASPRWSS